jgi:hypothetical protein
MIEQKNLKLIPLTEWAAHHSYPPIGQLRSLVFNAQKNGFDQCIRRIGRRVLIDEASFFAWVETQNQKLSGGAK